MICLLLEDMPEGEVKDLVKPGVVHQHVVKRKYRASAQVNYVESQMKSNSNRSQRILSLQIHTHIYLLVILHQYLQPIQCYAAFEKSNYS